MELVPSFEGRHYENQGDQKNQGPERGKRGEGGVQRGIYGVWYVWCSELWWTSTAAWWVGQVIRCTESVQVRNLEPV